MAQQSIRPSSEDFHLMLQFFERLEAMMADGDVDCGWMRSQWQELDHRWRRILLGIQAVVQYACDPARPTLSWVPMIEALVVDLPSKCPTSHRMVCDLKDRAMWDRGRFWGHWEVSASVSSIRLPDQAKLLAVASWLEYPTGPAVVRLAMIGDCVAQFQREGKSYSVDLRDYLLINNRLFLRNGTEPTLEGH